MRWLRSTQVLGGALIAALSSLASAGIVDEQTVILGTTLLGTLIALLRFRPGAGKPITDAQG